MARVHASLEQSDQAALVDGVPLRNESKICWGGFSSHDLRALLFRRAYKWSCEGTRLGKTISILICRMDL